MAQNDTENGPGSPVDAENEAGGGGSSRKRHRPLDSLERVRRELSAVYFQAKDGTMNMERAKGLTYLLSQLAAVLKAEAGNESELAALLAQVRDKLGKGAR